MFHYLSFTDDYIKYFLVSLNENRSEIEMTPFTRKDKPPVNSRHKVATAILTTCLLTTSGTSQAEPVTFTVLLIEGLKTAVAAVIAKETVDQGERILREAADHGPCGGPNSVWRGNLCDEVPDKS